MENVKHWLKSKTIQWLIALLIPVVSKSLGLDLGAWIAQATDMVQNHASLASWIDFALIVIPALFAALARYRATDKLHA